MLPYPALHASHSGVWIASRDGTREVSRGEAIALVADTPTIVLNAPLIGQRLGYAELSGLDLLELFKPDAVSIEELFFNTNITTGISVAHGRGVILLACRKAGVTVCEYTPLQVKQAVVGYGRAEKKQVMEMVKRICQLSALPKPDDAADAIALALCHARSSTSLLYREEREDCSTI